MQPTQALSLTNTNSSSISWSFPAQAQGIIAGVVAAFPLLARLDAPKRALALRRRLFSPEENAEFESPAGLRIPSKRWPNRVYALRPDHRGVTVYDDDRYVGSIVFSPADHVPSGDEHIYHAMMLAYHEDEVLAVAEYRPPREQVE
ncbi:MAG TPA: hypothetical protein VMG81_00800 [Thermoplasmata archaeon]|nr:hypothetical protein [Thermoplasmata archaeon]